MDKNCSETLKVLNIAGLSWLTSLFSVVWRSGTVPFEWQTGIVILDVSEPECVLQLPGYHTAQPTWESLLQDVGMEAAANCRNSDS